MAKKEVVRFDATRYNFFDNSMYSRSHGYNDEIETYEIDGETKVLPKSVVKLLKLIFDRTSIGNFLSTYLPGLGLSPPFSIGGLLSSSFSTLTNAIIPTPLKILNDIFLMRDAQNTIKEFENDPNALYRYYVKLRTKIRPLEKDCDEFKKISDYVENSHGPTHSDYKLEVMEIFKISRKYEYKKYEPFKDKIKFHKLLWHGSRLPNFASILMKGLQKAPNHVQRTGSMFGEGIYFADIVTKSANYCGTSRQNPIGVLLLAEVAIGNTYKLTKSENVTKLPKDKNSVKAYGKFQPDPKKHIYTKNHVQVPFGKPKEVDVNSCLQYNEYIVYDPDQILLQYLVQLKFIYE